MTEFSPNRYEMLVRTEQTHFWFRARRSVVLALIQKFCPKPVETLADIGCGSGYNLSFLKAHGENMFGIDRLVFLSPYRKTLAPNIQLLAGDVQNLPLRDQSVSLMTSLDVLEHVDDHKMLRELYRTLKPNSMLIVTVPALPWLWSNRDTLAGHKRRYTKAALSQALERAGFSIRYVNYYQFLLFPLILLSRLLWRKGQLQEREENPGNIINYILFRISMIENWLAKSGAKFPVGSSLIAVAQKP